MPDVDLDFEQLLYEAVAREAENLDGDDTEGYLFEPVASPFSSPTPLSPVPDGCNSVREPSPEPFALDGNVPLPQLSFYPMHPPSLSSPPASSSAQTLQPLPRKRRSYAKGSKEDIRRKERGNARRAAARLVAKQAAAYGDYAVKPRVINKHVRPAMAIDVKFDTAKLRHTKSAYTGGQFKGNAKRVYHLDELVGDGSKFKFRLETWDGR
jgi:hypothetical protein